MPCDLALLSTLIGSNYPCPELIFMVQKVFEPLKFECIQSIHIFRILWIYYINFDSDSKTLIHVCFTIITV